MGEFHPGRPAGLDGIAQVKIGELAVQPGNSARACSEGEPCIPGGQLMTDPWAEAIHEPEVRPGRSSGFHDHRRPGPDFNNHHNKTEFAQRCTAGLRPANCHSAHSRADGRRRTTTGPPASSQHANPAQLTLAAESRVSSNVPGAAVGGSPGAARAAGPRSRKTAAAAPPTRTRVTADQGDQGNSCYPGKPAPGRRTGITPWTLADLIQPSHLLQTGRCTSVSLSCLAGG